MKVNEVLPLMKQLMDGSTVLICGRSLLRSRLADYLASAVRNGVDGVGMGLANFNLAGH